MMPKPELFWISGSPPSWRVMLGLTLKGIAFRSRPLDHGAGEHRRAAYLALNPKGQVPTLIHGGLAVRESIAILAYLDRAFSARPIFGASAREAGQIWQIVMEAECGLGGAAAAIARTLLRTQSKARSADLPLQLTAFLAGVDSFEARLSEEPFLCGAAPTAADCWLYPTLFWIDRAVAITTDPVSDDLKDHVERRPALAAWRARLGALPGVRDTFPPHWVTSSLAKEET